MGCSPLGLLGRTGSVWGERCEAVPPCPHPCPKQPCLEMEPVTFSAVLWLCLAHSRRKILGCQRKQLFAAIL